MSVTQRAYTIAQVCELLAIPRRSFFHHRKHGHLPMCIELRPRIGRVVRYQAEPVDRYADGRGLGTSRAFFTSHRKYGT